MAITETDIRDHGDFGFLHRGVLATGFAVRVWAP